MDAFVSRSGSASEERKAAEAISVSTVTDPSEVGVHTVMPVESVAATTVHVIDSSDAWGSRTHCLFRKRWDPHAVTNRIV